MQQALLTALVENPELLRDALTTMMRERPDEFADLIDKNPKKRMRIVEAQQGSGTGQSTGTSPPSGLNSTPEEVGHNGSKYSSCLLSSSNTEPH